MISLCTPQMWGPLYIYKELLYRIVYVHTNTKLCFLSLLYICEHKLGLGKLWWLGVFVCFFYYIFVNLPNVL